MLEGESRVRGRLMSSGGGQGHCQKVSRGCHRSQGLYTVKCKDLGHGDG